MQAVNPFRIGIVANEYCSNNYVPIRQNIRTIEEGVALIEEILKRTILCRHHVQQINAIYKDICSLGKQVNPYVQDKIISTITRYNLFPNPIPHLFSVDDWISFHHLQKFSDPELRLKELFKNQWSQLPNKEKEEVELKLARAIPCCISEAKFNRDIQALIGTNPSEKTVSALEEKKGALRHHEQLKLQVSEKKKELESLRELNPHLYPPYLTELLDGGYIHLYDHLLEMRKLSDRNGRRLAAAQLSFSSLSHIALETREAIVRKVESSIPEDAQSILFLIGGSGSGKSTTLCFLRGDRMDCKNLQYESKNDQEQLIGNAGAISCTFLPKVEVVKGIVIVDFPGFEDSHGPIISMGMEFALRSLLTKYHAQILVIESITNVEGRYATAAQLGRRLERLIGNKKDCLLGITKYSKDGAYSQLQSIESRQRESSHSPSDEERVTAMLIQQMTDMKMAQESIGPLQQKLISLQQQRQARQLLPLEETEEKKALRQGIQERETELLKQIGLGEIIRFDQLEDPNLLRNCLEKLAKNTEPVRVQSARRLDSEDERFLGELFESKLKGDLENQEKYPHLTNFKEFEQLVLESSLINAISCQSNPEIGYFLHAPEMDPSLVKRYSRAIVSICINKCIKLTIHGLNMALIDKIVKEAKPAVSSGFKPEVDALEKDAQRLHDYILRLLGSLPEDPNKAKEIWEGIQQEQKAAMKQVEDDLKLLTLPDFVLPTAILLGLPGGIISCKLHMLWLSRIQEVKTTAIVEKTVEDIKQEIKQIQDALIGFKDLEKIITKQDELDRAFRSIPFSFESDSAFIQSIKEKIQAVRSVYAAEEWDERILFLYDKMERFDPKIFQSCQVPLMLYIFRFDLDSDVVRSYANNSTEENAFLSLRRGIAFYRRALTQTAELIYLSDFRRMIDEYENNRDVPLFRTMIASAFLNSLKD